MTGRWVGVLGHGGAALTWACAVAAVGLHLVNGGRGGDLTGWWFANALLAVLLASPGWLIATRRPENPIGWLLVGGGAVQAVSGLGREYVVLASGSDRWPGASGVVVVAEWIWPFTAAALLLVVLLFPDGRLLSPRWRWVARTLVVATVGFTTTSALAPGSVDLGASRLTNPIGLDSSVVTVLRVLSLLGLAVCAVWGCRGVVLRFRRSRDDERLQMRWFVAGGVVSVVELMSEFVLPVWLAAVLAPIAIGLFAMAISVAVLRYRLYDIDVVINRSLVYLALSGCLAGGYLGVVTLLGSRFGHAVPLGAAIVGTAVVALLLLPLRDRLQRGVNRLMYGGRDDPYGLLTGVSGRLGTAPTPAQTLPLLCRSVGEGLRLPYVGVEVVEPDGRRLLASFGRPAGEPTEFELGYQGVSLGRLLVSPRAGQHVLDPIDRRLLRDVASTAAVAVYADRVTTDLRRAHARVVEAREEERRRLRHDLHDGLGPTLAAVRMGADTARTLLASDPGRADDVLDGVRADAVDAVAALRRVVDGLRPASLDDLGLVPAIREQAARLGGDVCVIGVEASPGPMPVLPAAVEVAAYRIVTEALTNVVRHSGAQHAWVRLAVDRELRLSVSDDGRGLPAGCPPGVGLTSMAERATALGGRFRIEPRSPHGTTVVVEIPAPVPAGTPTQVPA